MISDIIGQKHGKLWAIGFNEMRNDPNFVIVICECGRYNEVSVSAFETMIFKCVCDNNKNDLTGKLFGTWKVISFTEKRKSMGYWKCVCVKCNIEKEIAYSNLTQRNGGICKNCIGKNESLNLKQPDLSQLNINLRGQGARLALLNSGDPDVIAFVRQQDALAQEGGIIQVDSEIVTLDQNGLHLAPSAFPAPSSAVPNVQEAPLLTSHPALPFPKAPWQS
jgi:hypothetical protein